jgi:NADH:ubiquinone oxidoreductase subunit E
MKCIKKKMNIKKGEMSEDGMLYIYEVECIGECVNDKMIKVNDE